MNFLSLFFSSSFRRALSYLAKNRLEKKVNPAAKTMPNKYHDSFITTKTAAIPAKARMTINANNPKINLKKGLSCSKKARPKTSPFATMYIIKTASPMIEDRSVTVLANARKTATNGVTVKTNFRRCLSSASRFDILSMHPTCAVK